MTTVQYIPDQRNRRPKQNCIRISSVIRYKRTCDEKPVDGLRQLRYARRVSGVVWSRWAARSSKPLGGCGTDPGGFDSHPLPPTHAAAHSVLRIRPYRRLQQMLICAATLSRAMRGKLPGINSMSLLADPVNSKIAVSGSCRKPSGAHQYARSRRYI